MWYLIQAVIIVLCTLLDDHHDPTLGILIALAITWACAKLMDALLFLRRGAFSLLQRKQARNRSRIHSAPRPRLP